MQSALRMPRPDLDCAHTHLHIYVCVVTQARVHRGSSSGAAQSSAGEQARAGPHKEGSSSTAGASSSSSSSCRLSDGTCVRWHVSDTVHKAAEVLGCLEGKEVAVDVHGDWERGRVSIGSLLSVSDSSCTRMACACACDVLYAIQLTHIHAHIVWSKCGYLKETPTYS